VVVGEGRVLEQGEPQALLANTESALSRLRHCEQQLLHGLLQDDSWQSLALANGRLQPGKIAVQDDIAVNTKSTNMTESTHA
jgi:hypothetical protein